MFSRVSSWKNKESIVIHNFIYNAAPVAGKRITAAKKIKGKEEKC